MLIGSKSTEEIAGQDTSHSKLSETPIELKLRFMSRMIGNIVLQETPE
jgi:hypothetical protein